MSYFVLFLFALLSSSCGMPIISHAMEDESSCDRAKDEVQTAMSELDVHKLARVPFHIAEQLPYSKLKTFNSDLILKYQGIDLEKKFTDMRMQKRNAWYEKYLEEIFSKNKSVSVSYEELDSNKPLVASFYTGAKALGFISECIERGADVNCPNRQTEYPPLMMAIDMLPEAVEPLLLAKADPNKRSGWHEKGITPLMLASLNNQCTIAEILIEHKADVNFIDGYNFSALTCAIFRERVEMVDLLSKSGASVRPCDMECARAPGVDEQKKQCILKVLES